MERDNGYLENGAGKRDSVGVAFAQKELVDELGAVVRIDARDRERDSRGVTPSKGFKDPLGGLFRTSRLAFQAVAAPALARPGASVQRSVVAFVAFRYAEISSWHRGRLGREPGVGRRAIHFGNAFEALTASRCYRVSRELKQP